MNFYLGTHMENWLDLLDYPLFVSHRRLVRRKRLPRARTGWALDSGGFTELSLHGRWVTSSRDYARAVQRYSDEIGKLEWCAPMDYMCEPFMLAKTGLTVADHQARTIDSYCVLASYGLPVVPVLQGWELRDYHAHVEQYDDAGINLASLRTVGLGSVCRRQHTSEIAGIVGSLADLGLSLHGFGIKMRGLDQYAHRLASCDSMAWSYNARRNPPLAGCTHANCSNCILWAGNWRERLLSKLSNGS